MIDDSRLRMVVAIFLMFAAPGCTTAQLRRTTVNQVGTVHDIYQQQILDNLAMFVHNRGSYPYFSLIGTGTTTLTDTATLADTNGWARDAANSLLYATAGLNPSWMRSKMGSWATYPINDSVKLTVMRCVYHAAVDGGLSAPAGSCPDCANLFYAYYNMEPPPGSNSIPYHGGPSNDPMDPSNTPHYSGKLTVKAASGNYKIDIDVPFGAQDQFKGYTLQFKTGDSYLVESSIAYGTNPNQKTSLIVSHPLKQDYYKIEFDLFLRKRNPIRGIVTPECLAFQQGWFCHGPKLPKHFDKCAPHGCYCGTYVWVPPGGIDQLTKLTLLIQDLAYYDPPMAGSQTTTTQKTTGTPGPTAATTALLNNMTRELQSNNALDAASRTRLQMHVQALQAITDQPDGSTQTTTTTTTTPPARQPTTFQPSILNLQQDLNLLPPHQ
jgi:hypothetical protein